MSPRALEAVVGLVLLAIPLCAVGYVIYECFKACVVHTRKHKARMEQLERDSLEVKFWKAETERLHEIYKQAPSCLVRERLRDQMAVAYRRHSEAFNEFKTKYGSLLK